MISNWGQLFNIPTPLRREDCLRAMTERVGRFVALDDRSLPGEGVIHVKLACREPKALRGKLEIFIFNVTGTDGNGADSKPPGDVDDDGNLDDSSSPYGSTMDAASKRADEQGSVWLAPWAPCLRIFGAWLGPGILQSCAWPSKLSLARDHAWW